jgi:hypothetical protein
LGDLNILLNPALEAYEFAQVDALQRQLTYPSSQTPQVVVFSSENDSARKFWFPLARAVTGPFRPNFRPDNEDAQGKLWGRALGDLPSQQSHELNVAAPDARDSLSEEDYGNPQKILAYDFTDRTVFAGLELSPSSPDPKGPGRMRYSPTLVVKTSRKVIDGHNDIFEPAFREFLTKYVAYTEGKRLLLRAQKLTAATRRGGPNDATDDRCARD